jgi:hypothetical protein
MTGAAVVVLFAQVASKTARDALFLGSFGAHALPAVMTAAAVLSLGTVLLGASLARRMRMSTLLPRALGVNAAAFAVELALGHVYPRATAVMLYLHVAALGALLVSGLWTLATVRFDPHLARRVIGQVATGATLGGALGGVGADAIHRLLGTDGLLTVLLAASVFAAVLVSRVGGPAGAPPRREVRVSARADVLREAPYLGSVAWLGVAIAASQALLDFGFKEQVAAAFDDTEGMIRFFGWYHTGVGLLTFALQWAVGSRLLERYGFVVPLAALPAFVALGGVGCVLVPVLGSMVILRGGETILANGVYHTGYEVLFTPLRDAVKRPAKLLVDVAATRLGDALGSAALLGVLSLVSDLSTRPLLVGVLVLGLGALAVLPRLERGYVATLVTALRDGVVRLDREQGLDAITRRTLGETRTAIDREHLLRGIEAFRRATTSDPPPAVSTDAVAERAARTPIVAEAKTLEELGTLDRSELRSRLLEPVDPRLARAVLPLLLDPAVETDARRALERDAAHALGSLEDALLDQSEDRRLRRWAAVLVGGVHTDRARDALVRGLGADAVEVRLACARALARMVRDEPALALVASSATPWLEAALAREAEPDAQGAPTSALLDEADRSLLDLPPATREALDPVACEVLELAAIVLDPRAIAAAARALAGTDEALRGTALEYLDHVLPRAARSKLMARLHESDDEAPSSRRSSAELEDSLLRARR